MNPDLSDVLLVLGALCLFGGVWMIYPPAALIVLGLTLILIAALISDVKAKRRAAATPTPAGS